MTPYQYAANIPTRFIDVNGDYIYINTSNGQLQYRDGKLYQKDDEGNWSREYEATKGSFEATITKSLNQLASGDYGSELVSFFSGESNDVTFQKHGTKNRYSRKEKGILIKESMEGSDVMTEEGKQKSPLYIAIGHEMQHGVDHQTTGINDDPWYYYTDQYGERKFVTKAEISAVHGENLIRAENYLPLRTNYSMGADKGPTLITKERTRRKYIIFGEIVGGQKGGASKINGFYYSKTVNKLKPYGVSGF